MIQFVQFHSVNAGKPMLVRIDEIESVQSYGENTELGLRSGVSIKVRGQVEDIISIIAGWVGTPWDGSPERGTED